MDFRFSSNEIICQEMGKRIKDYRISMNLTQAQLAENCGIPKRTVERIESGENKSIDNFLAVLRALNLLGKIDFLIPEQELRPTDIVFNKPVRLRASSKSNKSTTVKGIINWETDK
ncbi:MAG: helix-turn-helix domain-containing protein [Treponema sp.]|nr:helix-turn-helix domain-containing protein [Treponema sp.]